MKRKTLSTLIAVIMAFSCIAFSATDVFAKVNPDPVVSAGTQTYTVVAGDAMYKIAKQANVSLNELIRLNPQIKNPSRIYVGDILIIGAKPENTATPAPAATAKPAETAKPVATTAPAETEQPQAPSIDINIAGMKGPTGMGMVKLMDENEKGNAANNYNFSIAGTADEIVAKITKGELDIAAVPCNLAATLYAKTEGKINVLAVNTLGVLYLVDTTGQIKSIADLKGKTIYTTGQGTTPEFALNYVLEQNGLTPGKDVIIEFKSEATELAALLAAGKAEIAMLPEPFVTTVMSKNQNVKIALSLTDEWNKLQNDSKLLTGSIIVRSDFLKENKASVDAFLAEYKASVEFINNNINEGAALVGKYEIAAEEIARQAIPRCNIVYIDGVEMKADLSGYLKTLFDANAKSVGGKLPDDGFYYVK